MIDPTACPVATVPVPPPPTGPPEAAAWMWLIVLVAIPLFEWWAIRTGRRTLSQWLRKITARRRWVRWLGLGLLGWLAVHLFG